MTDNRYSRGKIYKLVNDVDEEFYVGSTCLPLYKRFAWHKEASKYRQSQIYQHFNHIGWDKVKIILIEEFPCNNKMELLRKEREYFDKLKPKLNTYRPFITEEERKTAFAEYYQEYRVQNKEHFEQMNKEYRAKNKDKISQTKKEYHQKNKDKIIQYVKEHTRRNITKVKEYRNEKVQCECGGESVRANLARHNRSEKHQQWLQSQPSTSS